MDKEQENPLRERLEGFRRSLRQRRLDAALVFDEFNIRSLTGVVCDNGCLVVRPDAVDFITDFRYVPMAHRVAPWLNTIELGHGATFAKLARRLAGKCRRIGYESSISAARYLALGKTFRGAAFVDVRDDLLHLRAVKTPQEIVAIVRAEDLNDQIWKLSLKEIKPGMTEKQIARVIQAYMIALGDGEAFDTIVCAGANAAECHHVPDDTVWQAGEPLLVDMGVKLDGVCSDMTRCIKPRGRRTAAAREYFKVYDIVLQANLAAIAAARPGITGAALDQVARGLIAKAGYGDCFGHSLGHGVGYEIHEQPTASSRSDKVKLEPGMFVTIEPGIYLEGRLGVRIEDLVLITANGCEVVSHSRK